MSMTKMGIIKVRRKGRGYTSFRHSMFPPCQNRLNWWHGLKPPAFNPKNESKWESSLFHPLKQRYLTKHLSFQDKAILQCTSALRIKQAPNWNGIAPCRGFLRRESRKWIWQPRPVKPHVSCGVDWDRRHTLHDVVHCPIDRQITSSRWTERNKWASPRAPNWQTMTPKYQRIKSNTSNYPGKRPQTVWK